jgi:glutathione S-transferase
MNIRSSFPNRGVTPEVQVDINRITTIWRDCRKRRRGRSARSCSAASPSPMRCSRRWSAGSGPIKIELDEVCQAYADAVWSLPSFQEWQEAAGHEPMIIEDAEF